MYTIHISQFAFRVQNLINPSAWSDEHCSSCCILSLIRLYLDNI